MERQPGLDEDLYIPKLSGSPFPDEIGIQGSKVITA